ncbi:hypothetical protein NFX46_20900 [Streptomyces phaeoluteigriseus]|uniref:DUF732 domain-containing protein n=1 Tax=Streptomyces phaeoluteigriseus TaxID=114686 RepID=A0ABY4ZA93_9ACTN|nr:hypothetical protein [Streptomyces phaeoluteigriseus]USQ85963.1 hypothetical protein NFX46_20900 [Streptomyces phaeoluteigriseus]
MSQQYPQQQPGQPYPPQQPVPGAPFPQPPKKRSAGKIAGLGCAGIFGLFVIIGVATSGGSDSTDNSAKDKAVAASDKPKSSAPKDAPKDEAAKEKAPAQATKTQAEKFQACVAKTGTATEKAAVKHVTKVTGADKRNDILDAAEVFTDFSGGMMGPHQGEGKLIASAFTSCYESDNGLVTVYDKDGEILANANY